MAVSQYLAELTKDPDAIRDLAIDWSALLPEGRTIASSVWTAATGLTASAGSIDATTTITSSRISGGTAGTDYELTNRITMDDSQREERTVLIRVRER